MEYKIDYEKSLERINAWYQGEIIDRPPVLMGMWAPPEKSFVEKEFLSESDRWMDVEYAIDRYLSSLKNTTFVGDSFPVFMPNLGPSVYSAFFGADIVFEPFTSWLKPCINDWSDLDKLKFDFNNIYFKRLEAMSKYAAEVGKGKFLLGYTDIHPGLDAVSAWRDPQELCYDLIDEPEMVVRAAEIATKPFAEMMEKFHTWTRGINNNLSTSWMGLPFEGKMHIPSCDFAAMISNDQFEKFAMPALREEVKAVDFNVFHVDGKGVANHLEQIMSLPNTNALQWVQGDGETLPVMQWIPLLKRMREGGKSIMVYLKAAELDEFMEKMKPEGLLLNIGTNSDDERNQIVEKVSKWS